MNIHFLLLSPGQPGAVEAVHVDRGPGRLSAAVYGTTEGGQGDRRRHNGDWLTAVS